MYDCTLKRWIDRIGRIMAVIGGVALTLMMLVVCVNIVSRRFLGNPIFGVQEIVRYLSLCIGSIGLLRLEWTDNSIRMTLFLEMTARKVRLIMELITNIVATAGFSVVTYYMFLQIGAYAESGQLTEDLKIPMTIPGAVLALGFACLTVCVTIKAALYAAALLKPAGSGPEADKGSASA